VPVSLDDASCVSIPASILSEIAQLNPDQSKHVQTELKKITSANYTPAKLVYEQYGDIKVFRCGDEMRLFGVVLENIDVVDEFDHLVILLGVSEHEYEQAGVTKKQAQEVQQAFGKVDSETAFWNQMNGRVFDEDDINSLFEPD